MDQLGAGDERVCCALSRASARRLANSAVGLNMGPCARYANRLAHIAKLESE